MVIHFSSNLSSKLSHLAQSFKPQHHFNFIRNAVPSSGSSTTSNVYTNSSLGGTSNSNNNNSNNNTTGTGSSGSAGGAGGAKYNAGSRAPNWGFAVSSSPFYTSARKAILISLFSSSFFFFRFFFSFLSSLYYI